MKRIPPHIAWPLLIVGFLLLGMTWSLSVVVASRSDGGPEVIENYYQKAIDWDQEAKRRALSDAHNWDISITQNMRAEGPELIVTILDDQGLPVNGLSGVIQAFRPQKSRAVDAMSLSQTGTREGVYTSAFPSLSRGLWDFQITAQRDSLVVHTTIRKEF